MEDLLTHILDALINEESYEIRETKEEGNVDYEIAVDPEQIGLVIGKGGKTVRAIRNLLKVRATLESVHVNLNITERQS